MTQRANVLLSRTVPARSFGMQKRSNVEPSTKPRGGSTTRWSKRTSYDAGPRPYELPPGLIVCSTNGSMSGGLLDAAAADGLRTQYHPCLPPSTQHSKLLAAPVEPAADNPGAGTASS